MAIDEVKFKWRNVQILIWIHTFYGIHIRHHFPTLKSSTRGRASKWINSESVPLFWIIPSRSLILYFDILIITLFSSNQKKWVWIGNHVIPPFQYLHSLDTISSCSAQFSENPIKYSDHFKCQKDMSLWFSQITPINGAYVFNWSAGL